MVWARAVKITTSVAERVMRDNAVYEIFADIWYSIVPKDWMVSIESQSLGSRWRIDKFNRFAEGVQVSEYYLIQK
jgi:hypothetical protein